MTIRVAQKKYIYIPAPRIQIRFFSLKLRKFVKNMQKFVLWMHRIIFSMHLMLFILKFDCALGWWLYLEWTFWLDKRTQKRKTASWKALRWKSRYLSHIHANYGWWFVCYIQKIFLGHWFVWWTGKMKNIFFNKKNRVILNHFSSDEWVGRRKSRNVVSNLAM